MGIFDFFKKKPLESKIAQKEVLNIQDLDKWVNENLSKTQNQKSTYHKNIKNQVSLLSKEIDQHTQNFERIEWDKIKEDERIKRIVKENLNNYAIYLNQLMSELSKLEESDISKEIIYSMFSAFEKKASMNYQKSTYLIGKEIELINKSISIFFKEINNLHEENKGALIKTSTLEEVKNSLKELSNIEITISKFNEQLKNYEKEVESSKKEVDKQEAILKEKINSVEFKNWQEKNKELQNKKDNLSREMQKLSNIIDFKKLAKIWHENIYEMSSLTEYRSNFIQTFQSDKGELLRKLIEQLENKETIKIVILKINELEREIENTNIEKSPALNFEKNIEEIRSKISNIQEKHLAENRKLEKVMLTKKPIINELKNNLTAFNQDIILNF